MLSRKIGVVLGGCLVFLLALTFLVDSKYALWGVPFFVALGGLYALHPAIDWWWANKHTPPMDSRLEIWIKKISPFYNSLSGVEAQKFRDRITLYLLANEYLLRSPEDFGAMPDDLKTYFAVPAVEMTFKKETEDWRLPKFERMVIYPNKFPSPNFPEHIHASEMETEDGVIIASLNDLNLWSQAPEKRFSILHYEMAKAFLFTYRNEKYPNALINWELLEKIGGFSEEQLRTEIIGLPNIDPMGVAISYYFTRRERMELEAPELGEAFGNIFDEPNKVKY